MSLAILGALALLFVVIRTWITSARWYDALMAIVLGYLIGVVGDGALNQAFDKITEWAVAGIDWLARLFT